MSRSEQLRQLAVQLLASLASTERALRASLLRLLSRSRSPLPKAGPQSAPRLNSAQSGPTGLAVKSCSPGSAWALGLLPSLLRLLDLRCWPVEPAIAVSEARAPILSASRAAAADPSASAARLARLRESSGAAEARRRSRDKRRRRSRRQSKRSMWRDILRPPCHVEHNTSDAFLLCADALIALVLWARLTDVDEGCPRGAGSPWT